MMRSRKDHDVRVEFMLQALIESPTANDDELIQPIKDVLFLNNDVSVKKKFLKCLDKIDCEQQVALIVSTISKIVSDMLSHSNTISSIKTASDVLKLLVEISSRTQTIVELSFLDVIKFYINALENFDQNLSYKSNKTSELEVVTSLHFLLQTIIVVIEKSCSFGNVHPNMMRKLYYALRRLLKYEQIPLNTMNNCGLLIVTLDYDYFELTSSFRLLTGSIRFAPKEHLSLCYGFVAVLPVELLLCPVKCSTIENCSLFVIILNSIYLLYHKYPNDCIILTSCLKVLCLLTQRISFSKTNVPSESMDFVISFLWSHLDHVQDIIKHLTRDCTSYLVNQKEEYCISKFLELIHTCKDLNRRTCVLISCLNNVIECSRLVSHRPELPIELLNNAKKDVSHSYFSQTFISLMISSYHEDDLEIWSSTWISPLLSSSCISTVCSNHVLLEALKLSPSVADRFLKFCRLADRKNYLIAVKCVLVLNRLNLITSNFPDEKSTPTPWRNSIPIAFMMEVVRLRGSEEGVATISMMMESCRKGTSITSDELQLFRIYLNSNICNLSNNQRSIFLSLASQIITRLVAVPNSQRDSSDTINLFSWLAGRCFANLFPGASFSRRNISLKLLEMMYNANVWRLETCDPQQKFLILTYLGDSFDENKITAKTLIQSTSFPSRFLNEEQVCALYTNIVDMISSARFCEHDTAIYLLELFLPHSHWFEVYRNCFACLEGATTNHLEVENLCLEENRYYYPLCTLAEVLDDRLRSKDPNECLRTRPVYGFIVLATRLFEHACESGFRVMDSVAEVRWKQLISKFSELCMEFNLLSTSVVSQSSPEGYLPQEELELMAEDSAGCYSSAQRLLLISWRTVKEASLMLAFFVEKFAFLRGAEVEAPRPVLVDEELVLRIGSHLASLIRGIKHRGAFEQVYIALCQYCRCCWRCTSNELISTLPQKWLEDLAICIETTEGTEELCALRRSAGVPCIVQAILSTEYDGKIRKRGRSQLLDTFVNRLLDICGRETDANDDGVPESKIHAANILRALFRNKDLDEQMSFYVERALVLAVLGVQSPFWNERNVCWLLFSSLMTKIFGVARCKHEISVKNKMTVKMFFRKYPSLYEFFKKRLQTIGESEASNACARSSLYPILLIFERLEVHSGCSREQYDTFELNSFIPLLLECSRSPVWKIRELVVSAIFPFVTIDIYEQHLATLWNRVRSDLSENFIHGLLLQLETFLANVPVLGRGLEAQLQPLFSTMLEDAVAIFEVKSISHSNVVERQFLHVVVWLLRLMSPETRTSTEHVRVQLQGELQSRIEKSFQQDSAVESTNCDRIQKGMLLEDLMLASFCVLAWRSFKSTITFLEYIVTRKPIASRATDMILDAISCVVSEDDFMPRNALLKHAPGIPPAARERARYSDKLYSYVSQRISKDCSDCDVFVLKSKILRAILNQRKWLMHYRTTHCLKILMGERNLLDEDSLGALVECADLVAECSMEPTDICVSTLKTLITYLEDTWSENVCRMLMKFYFRYCRSFSWQDTNLATLRLSAWTLMLQYALSPSESGCSFECEEEYFPRSANASSFPEIVMESFYLETKCEHLIAAIAFVSWILQHVGILREDETTNTIFVQNVPHTLEDDIIISQLASTCLERVVADRPEVLHLLLSEELIQWIQKRCALEGHHFIILQQCIDIASCIRVKPAAQDFPSIELIRVDSWRSTMLSSKLRLLSDMYEKIDSRLTGKNTCI